MTPAEGARVARRRTHGGATTSTRPRPAPAPARAGRAGGIGPFTGRPSSRGETSRGPAAGAPRGRRRGRAAVTVPRAAAAPPPAPGSVPDDAPSRPGAAQGAGAGPQEGQPGETERGDSACTNPSVGGHDDGQDPQGATQVMPPTVFDPEFLGTETAAGPGAREDDAEAPAAAAAAAAGPVLPELRPGPEAGADGGADAAPPPPAAPSLSDAVEEAMGLSNALSDPDVLPEAEAEPEDDPPLVVVPEILSFADLEEPAGVDGGPGEGAEGEGADGEAEAGAAGEPAIEAESPAAARPPPSLLGRLVPREDRVLLLQVATCAVAYVTDPILSLVDTAFVSRLGTVPLAAMGPNNTVYSNIIGVIAAASFSTAATRLVAQSLTGRQGEVTDPHKMVTCIAATTFGLGLAVAAALLAAPEFYLNLVGCKAAIRGPALEYFRIRAAGVPFGLLLLGLQGCYHAATDTVTPLVAVLASGALNGVLDPFLMFTCGLGVAGAAAATVAAQVAAAGWLAYRVFWGRDRRTFGFDRPPVPPTLPASVITGVSTENVWRNLYEWDQWQHAWSRYSASAWQSLVPHLHVFQAYLAETAAFMARAVQIVLVWSLTATFAAYCGVPETAAHQLVLSLFVFQCNLMTAYTTIGTVVAARGMASSSLEKVARVANRLTVYALATAGLLAAGTIAGRHALIAFFTRDPLVVAPATTAMVSAAGMVAISWFKALEGILIGIGDSSSVSAIFLPALGVTIGGLWLAHSLALGLDGVWAALLAYYVVLLGGLGGRWVWLQVRWSRDKEGLEHKVEVEDAAAEGKLKTA